MNCGSRYLQSVKTRQISLFVAAPPVLTHYPTPIFSLNFPQNPPPPPPFQFKCPTKSDLIINSNFNKLSVNRSRKTFTLCNLSFLQNYLKTENIYRNSHAEIQSVILNSSYQCNMSEGDFLLAFDLFFRITS